MGYALYGVFYFVYNILLIVLLNRLAAGMHFALTSESRFERVYVEL